MTPVAGFGKLRKPKPTDCVGGGPQFPEERMLEDFSPHQQKIIKRYYSNQDTIVRQRLAELVSDLFLSEGKKRLKTWGQIEAAMQKLGVPQAQIDHLKKKDDAAILAKVIKDL